MKPAVSANGFANVNSPNPPNQDSRSGGEAQALTPTTRQTSGWASELPKYSVAAVFVFYTVGFVIWQAHLSRWGINAPWLLKLEFFSAALCFLAIVASIGLPGAMLFEFLRKANQKESWLVKDVPAFALIMITAALLGQINSIFLPSRSYNVWLLFLSVGLPLLHLLVFVILRKWLPENRATTLIGNRTWIAAYFLLSNAGFLMSSSRSDLSFIVQTLLLYLLLMTVGGLMPLVHLDWRIFPIHFKSLLLLCMGLMLLAHARNFGRSQFSRIPQFVGGGEPVQAFFAFNSADSNLPSLLEIPRMQNGTDSNALSSVSVIATNGTNVSTLSTNASSLSTNLVAQDVDLRFFGPVQIIMRSDREILFFVSPTSTPINFPRPEAKMIKTDSLRAIRFIQDGRRY